MNLGEKIQLSRKKKGMSQEDLANLLNVSRQAVQKWESGASKPELDKITELSNVLDVSLDWLLKDKEDNSDSVATETPTVQTTISSEKVLDRGTFKVIKVWIILGMIFTPLLFTGQFFLNNPTQSPFAFLGLLLFGVTIPLGIITISKLKTASSKGPLIGWGIVTLILVSFLGGILILCIKDNKFVVIDSVANSTNNPKTVKVKKEKQPMSEESKKKLKKGLTIGGISLLVAGIVATCVIVPIAIEKNKPIDKWFEGEENSFLVHGYEKTEIIDGVSYAFGKNGSQKSLYIVGVNRTFPYFQKEIDGYYLENMLFDSFNKRKDFVEVTFPEHEIFYDMGLNGIRFDNCIKLKEVNLPFGLKKIGGFYKCSSLTNISLPINVEEIYPSGFAYCSALEELKIPYKVTELEASTFENCTSLKKVELPINLTKIGDEGDVLKGKTFYNCTSLSDITIPNTVTVFGESTFEGCSSLAELSLPTNMTYIGAAAFANCSNLKTMTLPTNLKTINVGLFAGCSSLESVVLPSSLTTINHRVFEECTKLSSVTFLGTKAQWASISIDGNIFTSTAVTTIHCSDGDLAL